MKDERPYHGYMPARDFRDRDSYNQWRALSGKDRATLVMLAESPSHVERAREKRLTAYGLITRVDRERPARWIPTAQGRLLLQSYHVEGNAT